jgi:hypothetical protein
MGTDIHMFAERLVNGWWVPISGEIDIDRNYELFNILAGIRRAGPYPIMADQRGIPEDVSPQNEAQYQDWTTDAHSASWLSLEELQKYLTQHPGILTEPFVNKFWTSVVPMLGRCTLHSDCAEAGEEMQRACIEHPGTVRIVFWFDN